jgi:hypothetical protein
MNEAQHSRRAYQSVGAVLAGVLADAVLSLGTDEVFHMLKVYPPWGERMSDGLFWLATAYRIAYSILSGYLTARFAPYKPMQHALVLGAIGLVVSIAGTVATWNRDLGPHWYSIVVIAIALPCAWAGAALFLRRRQLPA